MNEVQQKKTQKMQVRVVKEQPQLVIKAENTTQISKQDAFNSSEWLNHPVDLRGLKSLVSNSSILPQCIRAYKNNIAGFGIGIRYKEDIEETPEMIKEWELASELIELLNLEEDTKKVFEDIVEAREIYGISYIEVMRNLKGEVNQIEFIRDIPSIHKTCALEPYIDIDFIFNGQIEKRKKKFCKYRQQLGGKTVYFKEFGDPRIMDNRSGKYINDGETLESQYQANEIIEFAIGLEDYGEVRWIGQVLGVDGSRKAEQLNNNYFENGRHTPLLIMIKGGTLTDESFDKLQEYMDDIKGASGQHGFIILETENADNKVGYADDEKPEIEVKDLASILQKDELFQEYLDNNRRRVQSAFQLPDLYVGYTTDFNRATAQTAMEVTEKQVFQPERKSLAWIINNKLLNEYQFKYVEVFFKEPDITNVDDLYKILTVCNNAGGLTPNKAKAILYDILGDTYEDFEGDWGEIPLAYSKTQTSTASPLGGLFMSEQIKGLEAQIKKAAANHDDAVVAVMKEVRSLLLKMNKEGK